MDIKQTMEQIYQNNVKKGFWDEKRNVGEMLMLIVSELAEALEADRKSDDIPHRTMGVPLDERLYNEDPMPDEEFKKVFEADIKNTFEDEMADAVIRIFDICEGMCIDLPFQIRQKMRYNSLRPHKHGKKY